MKKINRVRKKTAGHAQRIKGTKGKRKKENGKQNTENAVQGKWNENEAKKKMKKYKAWPHEEEGSREELEENKTKINSSNIVSVTIVEKKRNWTYFILVRGTEIK